MFEDTPQFAKWLQQTYGGGSTPRDIVIRNWPFQIPDTSCPAPLYLRLLDHGEYVATGGRGMSNDTLRDLTKFYQTLRDERAVVEYDPKNGVSESGGLSLVPREQKDGDLIIRVNEHTQLTDEGEMIWRFPPHDPVAD
ncbi:hypothetical protein [Mycobacterium angelicum]|uniref:Uncharacterized protein n=1 Tax=Mycobacterium angelicum TaxID=470074 RepID=A0A1W9ZCA7_MYCAN|nr:hypothetical protein [Mycobacterium angelicum]MCV7195154.1 XRE family transcriptional regulator [Mycobacterium angelicum]ORA11520.1 hypothetical protein BST12_25745 [Mycobacterium angelicum]